MILKLSQNEFKCRRRRRFRDVRCLCSCRQTAIVITFSNRFSRSTRLTQPKNRIDLHKITVAHSIAKCNIVFSNGTTDIDYVQLTLFQEFSSQRYCYCLFDSRWCSNSIECGWWCGWWLCCYCCCCCNGCGSQCRFGYFVHNSTYLTVLVLWVAEKKNKTK